MDVELHEAVLVLDIGEEGLAHDALGGEAAGDFGAEDAAFGQGGKGRFDARAVLQAADGVAVGAFATLGNLFGFLAADEEHVFTRAVVGLLRASHLIFGHGWFFLAQMDGCGAGAGSRRGVGEGNDTKSIM